MSHKFNKDDSEKVNLNIIFDVPFALEEVAKVMEYGAIKYSRKNWDKVEDLERYKSASLRHKLAQEKGEVVDPESRLLHRAHEITSLLFLLEIKEMQT